MHLATFVVLALLSCALPAEGHKPGRPRPPAANLQGKARRGEKNGAESTGNFPGKKSPIGRSRTPEGNFTETYEIVSNATYALRNEPRNVQGRVHARKSLREFPGDRERSRVLARNQRTTSGFGGKEPNGTRGGFETNSNLSAGTAEVERRARNSSLDVEISRRNDATSKSPTEEVGGRTANWEPEEEDFLEAANFGLQAMHELYHVKEPELYAMGLYLENDNPARYVAAFNDQTEEARALAKYGFAVLQGTTRFMRKFPEMRKGLILSRRNRGNPLQRQCPNRGTPDCPGASLRYRTSDGSCNNLEHLWWGSAMSAMQRFLPAAYQDGVQSIRRSRSGRPLPSARDVSSILHEDRDVPLASVTHMLMQWGQFVDHDLTATGQSRGFNGTVPRCCLVGGSGFQPPEFMHPECQPIPVNPQDSFFGPLGVRCLEFLRSGAAPKEDCEFGPREQLSQVTSYLDASTVYSSNAFQTDTLRLFRNGLLQYGKIQTRRPLLPRRETDLCKQGSLSTGCFRAGDGRLSEQPALTSLHVVFLRLHNRVATKLAALNFHWSDEKLFQESRRIVAAVVQHITYREFLPIVLGQEVMKIFDLEVLRKGYYDGYDPTVNPTIANGFSTAAYRFGHSLVQHSFVRFSTHHKPLFNNVSIHEEFSNPTNLETAGSVDRLLLGLVNQPSQRRDEFITEELTNHLFQTPRFPFGMDLASLNIQRGRDHGIPAYVSWREPCGLSAIRSFDDLNRVMTPDSVRKFRLLYESVEDIDLFPAGLAENSVAGGLVGPTFACIIAQQFANLRRGDRFWYENPGRESSFTPGQLQQIRRVTLAQVLCWTMDQIDTIQPFIFLTQDSLRNRRVSCDDPAIGELDLEFWAEKPPQVRTRNAEPGKSNRKTGTSQEDDYGAEERLGPNKEQTKLFPTRQSPVKSSIHQHNKIVVRRPLGPPDNVTIVVQNNAVNAPVFVNDAIYGSHVTPRPSFADQRPIDQDAQSFPSYGPAARPIPTSIPNPPGYTRYPYVPMGFNDPSNPNPLNYGFHSSGRPTADVLFESFPLTSPRPTLYTYYTNVLQRPSTQKPQEVDGYLVNYRPQEQGQTHATSMSMSSWPSLGSNFEPNQQQSYRPTATGSAYQKEPSKVSNWREPQPYGATEQQQQQQHKIQQLYPQPPQHPQLQHKQYQQRPQDYPQQQQQFTGNWNAQSYQTRPTNHPGQQNDETWHLQSYQTGSKPYDRDDLNRETPKPLSQKQHGARPSVMSLPSGIRPGSLHDSGIPRPIYQHAKRPIQADPDGWSTLPVYQKEPIRPAGYHETATSVDKVRPSGGGPIPYNDRPGGRPTVGQTESNRFPEKSPYQKGPGGFPAQPGELIGSLSSIGPTRGPLPIAETKFDGTENPGAYQRPGSQLPGGADDWKNYKPGENPASNYQLPAFQDGDRLTVQSHFPSPISRPITAGNETRGESENQFYKNPGAGGPTVDRFDGTASSPLYQTRTEPPVSSVRPPVTETYAKPSKTYSVTIITESAVSVDETGYLANETEEKVTSEVPKPLVARPGSDKFVRKPGQYYYEKNVLHRYPDDQPVATSSYRSRIEADEQSPGEPESLGKDINAEGTREDRHYGDKETRSEDGKRGEGDFSEDVESPALRDRAIQWLNLEEDPELPSMQELPKIGAEGSPRSLELPRPMKLGSHVP